MSDTEIINKFRELVESFPHHKPIFTDEYYASLDLQLKKFRKDKGTHINPIFLWYFRDGETEAKRKLALLDKFIKQVFSTSKSNHEKKHIAAQLRTIDAYDTVFELSILSVLIEAVPKDAIELFPTTTGNHDVEARVKLVDRWVYIEVSVLKDSKEDADEITELLRKGGGVGKMKAIDLNKGKYRLVGKSAYKARQFLPTSPNLLIVALLTTQILAHDFPELDTSTINVDNIGAVMKFDFNFKYRGFQDGVPSCQLTEKEKKKLTEIFATK